MNSFLMDAISNTDWAKEAAFLRANTFLHAIQGRMNGSKPIYSQFPTGNTRVQVPSISLTFAQMIYLTY